MPQSWAAARVSSHFNDGDLINAAAVEPTEVSGRAKEPLLL